MKKLRAQEVLLAKKNRAGKTVAPVNQLVHRGEPVPGCFCGKEASCEKRKFFLDGKSFCS
jgi:hypothetical protein